MILFTAYEDSLLVEYFNTDSRRMKTVSSALVILFAANRYAKREGARGIFPSGAQLYSAYHWEAPSPYRSI
jgi:hypothetical protein